MVGVLRGVVGVEALALGGEVVQAAEARTSVPHSTRHTRRQSCRGKYLSASLNPPPTPP
jgi:hypothetical protein